MSIYYYGGPENKPLGTCSVEDIQKLSDQGEIGDDTLVISEGDTKWVRFADWKAAQGTSVGDFPPPPPDNVPLPAHFASPSDNAQNRATIATRQYHP